MHDRSIHIERVSTPELHRLLGRFLAEIEVNLDGEGRSESVRTALRRARDVSAELRMRGEQLSFDLRER